MSLTDDNIIIAPTNIHNPNLSNFSVLESNNQAAHLNTNEVKHNVQQINQTLTAPGLSNSYSNGVKDDEIITPFYKKRWFLMSIIVIIIISITALLYLYFTTNDIKKSENQCPIQTIGSGLGGLSSIKAYNEEDDNESSIDVPITRFNKLEKISESSENEDSGETIEIIDQDDKKLSENSNLVTVEKFEPIVELIEPNNTFQELNFKKIEEIEETKESEESEETKDFSSDKLSDDNVNNDGDLDDESFEKFKTMFDD